MTLRTKSKARQWAVWLTAAFVLLAVYAVLSRYLYGTTGLGLFVPRQHRLLIPVLALFVYIVRETRWDGVKREKKKAEREGEGGAEVKGAGQGQQRIVQRIPAGRQDKKSEPPSLTSASAVAPSSPSHVDPTPPSAPSDSAPDGEALYAQARALPHQKIPDLYADAKYLDLLWQSAKAGYAPAMTKLGQYAMRRATWVESYYWMKLAQRNGMRGLSPTLRMIRTNWSRFGFPGESRNVNQIFDAEAGSIGRALLHVDSGREASMAREFLKKNHPEFLT